MSLLKKIGKVIGKVATGDLLGAAGTVIGAVAGAKGSKKAGNVSAAGAEANAAEQRGALTTATGYQQPYIDAGTPAVNALMRTNAGDYSGFESSPDFLAAMNYGAKARERSAAARGGLNSGNTLIDLERFGQDTATQYLGNYRNALLQQIGVGQRATDTITGATLDTGRGVGNALMAAGDSRASGIVGSTNAITGGIEDLSGVAGDYYANKLIKKPKSAPKMALNVRMPTAQRAA